MMRRIDPKRLERFLSPRSVAIAELDPVIVYAVGEGCSVGDVLLVLAPEEAVA
ncbi:MAG: hypothetical protein ACLPID_02205 [Beijerinckiaceae bacterium]